PWRAEFVPLDLKTGKAPQKWAALDPVGVKISPSARGRLGPEVFEALAKRPPFQHGHALVVDPLAFAQARRLAFALDKIPRSEFGNSVQVDIERIEKQPAVG